MNYGITKSSIEKGAVLSQEDLDYISSSISEIQANWEKRQVFRTETEMRISVLNDTKFPTPASKYWQCVREQGVFYENLVTLSFQYRRNRIEQAQIRKKIEETEDELERELLQIDLEEKQFGQMNMEQVAKDRVREIRLWATLMAEQVQKDDFDTENVNTHQLLSYTKRFQQQAQNIGASQSSISEINNLLGQYHTAIRHIEEIRNKKMLEDKQKQKALGKSEAVVQLPVEKFPSLNIQLTQKAEAEHAVRKGD